MKIVTLNIIQKHSVLVMGESKEANISALITIDDIIPENKKEFVAEKLKELLGAIDKYTVV